MGGVERGKDEPPLVLAFYLFLNQRARNIRHNSLITQRLCVSIEHTVGVRAPIGFAVNNPVLFGVLGVSTETIT